MQFDPNVKGKAQALPYRPHPSRAARLGTPGRANARFVRLARLGTPGRASAPLERARLALGR